MHARQIELIRDSFVHVLFDPDRAGDVFYRRLFELSPDTRALFKSNMDEQARVLIRSIATIVTGLARFDTMVPTLNDLARRHVEYGATPQHYTAVGVAMIDMLETVCPDFSALDRETWQEAYALIADTMIAAAYQTRGDPAHCDLG